MWRNMLAANRRLWCPGLVEDLQLLSRPPSCFLTSSLHAKLDNTNQIYKKLGKKRVLSLVQPPNWDIALETVQEIFMYYKPLFLSRWQTLFLASKPNTKLDIGCLVRDSLSDKRVMILSFQTQLRYYTWHGVRHVSHTVVVHDCHTQFLKSKFNTKQDTRYKSLWQFEIQIDCQNYLRCHTGDVLRHVFYIPLLILSVTSVFTRAHLT